MKKSTKKSVAFATLAFATAIATPAIVQTSTNEVNAASPVKFTDIDKHWAKDMIYEAVQLGYVNGYVDGTFKPDTYVSNSEFIKMLTVAVNPNGDYTTQKGEVWYKPYVDEAIKQGLITNSEFPQMTANMKRSDLAKLGVRGLGIKNTDAKKWMYLATTNGLINGTDSKGTLKENGTMTRGEAVTVINRVLKAKAGEKLPTDKRAIANAEILWHNTNIFTMLPQWFRPDTMDRYVVNDGKLTSSSPDKNFVSKAKKLVVIDTDDVNDPNRHLLQGLELSVIDEKQQKIVYISPLKKNGYIILSVNELTIKDTNNMPINNMLGASFEVSIGNPKGYIHALIKRLPNGGSESRFISFTKGQAKKVHEYKDGFWISKDYQMEHMDNIQIYFRGIYEWGDMNGSLLYDAQYIQK